MSYQASLNRFLDKRGVTDMCDFALNHDKYMNEYNDFSKFTQLLSNSTLEYDEQYLRWFASRYPASPYEQEVVNEILEKHMNEDINRTFDFESMFDDQEEIKMATAKAENAVTVDKPSKQIEVMVSEKNVKRKHRGKDINVMKREYEEEDATSAKKKKPGRPNKTEQLCSTALFVNNDMRLVSRFIQFQGKKVSIITDITENITIDTEEQFNILTFISNERKTILNKIDDVKNQLINLKNIEEYILKKIL